MRKRKEKRAGEGGVASGNIELACPNCGGKTRVVETRGACGNALRRRRECTICGERRTTREQYL